jgi:hypothetical protein
MGDMGELVFYMSEWVWELLECLIVSSKDYSEVGVRKCDRVRVGEVVVGEGWMEDLDD